MKAIKEYKNQTLLKIVFGHLVDLYFNILWQQILEIFSTEAATGVVALKKSS